MRFVCESCRAQYMINDEKVGPKGVKVRCRKCGYVILVKRADAAKAGGPIAQSNDPDDALATQVMQTPLAAAEATLSNEDASHAAEEMTSPGTATSSPTLAEAPAGPPGPKDSFFGADEDEIGAVFDQVLKTGNNHAHKPGEELGSPDDRQSTRVIDADTVRKLAEESNGKEKAAEPKAEEIPQTDWYVAINEKQTGPLTLEKVKEHWDRGEISPDSLCWRAGYDDWIPVSDVKMLNSVLAPKPPKPIVVAPAATITQSGPAVMNVPVQSAFSAGGMVQTVQSQMQVPMSAGGLGPEETNSWKPSAANSLGSLLKDEMEAQARPPPKAPPPAIVAEQGGLLDLPSHQEEKATNGATVLPNPVEHRDDRPARAAPPPPNPYLQNPGATYSAPAMTQYRPPNNRNLMIGVAAGGAVMLLILVGLIVWLATRQQPTVVVAPTPNPPVVVQPPPVNPNPVNPNPVNPNPVNPNPAAGNPAVNPTVAANPTGTNPAGTNPAGTNPAVVPANPTLPPNAVAAVVNPPAPAPVAPKSTGSSRPKTNVAAKPERDPEPEPKKVEKAAPSGGDDFDEAFGAAPKKSTKEEPKSEKKQPGYIPPAPGGSSADVKESLGQSDIMEVVLANKASLGKCVEEQRKKDPGTSGKLLMKWTIQTSGRTAGVSVASEEFKGTPIAGCVGALIKGMQFPKHKKQGDPITFPFKF
jgi:predicted Zn finger-like uncharacterized protein